MDSSDPEKPLTVEERLAIFEESIRLQRAREQKLGPIEPAEDRGWTREAHRPRLKTWGYRRLSLKGRLKLTHPPPMLLRTVPSGTSVGSPTVSTWGGGGHGRQAVLSSPRCPEAHPLGSPRSSSL